MNWSILIAGIAMVFFAGGQILIYNRSTSNYIRTISIVSGIVSFLAGVWLILLGLVK